MAGRPGTLPWNMATFTGANPVTTLSDNFNFLNNQINDSGTGFTSYATDIGTPNNYVANLFSPAVAYEPGMNVALFVTNTNSGASVVNFNALGNVPVVTNAGNPLLGGELLRQRISFLVFDGTNFRVLNHGVAVSPGSTGANLTVECNGCMSVAVAVTFTAVNLTVTLAHLGQSVPVTVYIGNGSGSAGAFSVSASTPSGAAFVGVFTVVAGGAGTQTNIQGGIGSFNLSNGTVRIFSGQAVGNSLYLT